MNLEITDLLGTVVMEMTVTFADFQQVVKTLKETYPPDKYYVRITRRV